MHSVYILRPDHEHEEIGPRNVDAEVFCGSPIGERWGFPEFVLHRDLLDPVLPPGDFPNAGFPLFSARAADVLGDLLAPNGELLPVTYDGDRYWAFNCTTLVDALDPARAEIERFPGGRPYRVRRHAFLPDVVRAHTVFKLRDFPRSSVYVAQVFFDRVGKHGLVGFDLKIADGTA